MNGEKRKRNILVVFIEALKKESERRKSERGALTADITVFLVAFFFAGRHIAFGSYPLGSAFVAILPSRVLIALVGAVLGSLAMGKAGIIHAIIVLLIFMSRMLISAWEAKESERELFGEPIIMRLAAAAIGAFLGSGYEIILRAFSFPSVLFGVFGIGAILGFAFIFSGLFFVDLSVFDFLFGERALLRKKQEGEEKGLIFFQASFCVICFLISLSLKKYDYFGISFAYLFSVVLTLFISKRFGSLRGMAIGFISTLGIAPLYSPGFAILGAVSGLLYSYSVGYAIIGGGFLLGCWALYVGGTLGLLSVLVEFLIASAFMYRALKYLPAEKEETVSESLMKSAEEMVGASWLSRERKGERFSSLCKALICASDRITEISEADTSFDIDRYRDICVNVFEEEKLPKVREIIERIALKLSKKEKFSARDEEEMCISHSVIEKITSRAAFYERMMYFKRRGGSASEQYTAISKMISEALDREIDADSLNIPLTDAAKEVFSSMGFPEGCIKVFGEERIKVVGAGTDKDGRLITSPELKSALEEALGYRLGSYEYFRRGDMALFTASAAKAFTVEYATVSESAKTGEVSGDSAKFFGNDSEFYAVISDGMGTGREARVSSEFVSAYLSDMLSAEVGILSAISSLGDLLRQREGEASATVDLFSFNLLNGEAVFTKCGAASSYVKRGKSIFRIRSESAPIGLIESLDAEKIRVEVKSGDTVIMFSDGVSASSADASWLLAFLSKEEFSTVSDVDEYAKKILSLAKEHSESRDDMTVSVINILSKYG